MGERKGKRKKERKKEYNIAPVKPLHVVIHPERIDPVS